MLISSGALGLVFAGSTLLTSCLPKERTVAPLQAGIKAENCRTCHEQIYATWAESHHAKANRPVRAELDREAFDPPAQIAIGNARHSMSWRGGAPVLQDHYGEQPPREYFPDMALGYAPLRQYTVLMDRGFWQTTEQAYDPVKKEWFNAFGGENRQPGEWGHWTGRGMNWNSMCAHCHMTGLQKNYDAATDSYRTAWSEHGISCVQCHGPMAGHAQTPEKRSASPHHNPALMMETCAACHSRSELLTGGVQPGGRFADHHRLVLPVAPGIYYPDGQIQDEDFEYGSFVRSRMHHAGVTCLDCHDPHGGKLRVPLANNLLCLQCHATGGRPGLSVPAPIIDPLAHSHHQAGSKGNDCVGCHMPTTTYMQRHPRRDHGFLSPDPLLTQELGIPNACSRCHSDQPLEWSISAAEKWYGPRLDSRQRARARAVAAAQRGDPASGTQLLKLIETETIPSWRATLLLLARPHLAAEPRLLPAIRTALHDPDAQVRSSAIRAGGDHDALRPAIRPLLQDPARMVRLDAAWTLSPELPGDSPARRELDDFLRVSLDQPAGQAQRGQDFLNRGRATEALVHFRQAVAWDPKSADLHRMLGLALNALGQTADAAAALAQAAGLAPRDASLPFQAALAFAGAGDAPAAETWLREAVRREARFDRAWYNLSLLLAQSGRRTEALATLRTAAEIAPLEADYAYAEAVLLWQENDRAAALAAAQRALKLNPNHAAAAALLRQAANER